MIGDESIGILAVVPERWTDNVMGRHQVLRRLANHHFPVVWIEPPRDWREYTRLSRGHFLETDRWSSPHAGLDVLTPGFRHPFLYRPHSLERLSLRSRLAVARRRLVARGAQRLVLYLWRDSFAPALDLVPHDLSCYHLVDEYSFSELDPPISARELDLLQRVDQVIVHSPALAKKKGGINPHTTEIPNGVDYRAYSTSRAMPLDLTAIPSPRIGYTGVVKKQLDLALLVRLARARAHYSFVLVGPVMNVAGKEAYVDELRRMPNVHFIGNKPPEELPAYVQHFDVCLMCYEMNAYTKFIYPLKLNEYLAAGRPTIATPIETVARLGSVVALARTDEQWLAALDDSLMPVAREAEAVARRRAFARNNDWDQLVDRIADTIREGLGAKSTVLALSANEARSRPHPPNAGRRSAIRETQPARRSPRL